MKAAAAATTDTTPMRRVTATDEVTPQSSGAAIIRLVTATRSEATRMSTNTTPAMISRARNAGPWPASGGCLDAGVIGAFCPTRRAQG